MKRIDADTVELTKAEQRVANRFDFWLYEGHSIYEALGRVLVIDELPVGVNLAYWLALGSTPGSRVWKAHKRAEHAAKLS
jgi:hypothetical protein